MDRTLAALLVTLAVIAGCSVGADTEPGGFDDKDPRAASITFTF